VTRPATSGCVDRVHFAGRLADPTPAFHAADVFALPSAYESFGLVVLEALAFGLPVVVTDVGVVPEVVDDGVNGFVVTADAREIVTASSSSPVCLATGSGARPGPRPRSTGGTGVARRYLTLLEGLGARFDLSADVDAETAGAAVS
jgi:UDP-glucose:(heptosyl)LPS alpha-1,3-glucosyltransferase